MKLPVLNYFQCKPNELCEGAQCCTTPETSLTLSVGDYLRLSKATGDSVEKIWLEKGIINFNLYGDNPDCLEVSLGLLHDPCPYLNADFKCDVYKTRPTGCASFPLLMQAQNDEQITATYSSYRCLQRVSAKPEQLRLAEKLQQIIDSEAKIDFTEFWNKNLISYEINKVGDIINLAKSAADNQIKRDSSETHARSRRIVNALKNLEKRLENANQHNGFNMHAQEFSALASDFGYAIWQDDILERFKRIQQNPSAMAAYEQTSRQWNALVAKIE